MEGGDNEMTKQDVRMQGMVMDHIKRVFFSQEKYNMSQGNAILI